MVDLLFTFLGKGKGGIGEFWVGADPASATPGEFYAPVSVAKMGLYSKALSATEIAAIHDGARTAEGAAARRSVAQAMCWDREGELVKTLTTGETCTDGVVDELGEAEYVYTGAGERVIRADAEAVTIYLPGGQEVTIPRDSTRNVSAHRYYTFSGETIAVRDQRGLGGVTSLVNDHHGTPIAAIPNTTWTSNSVRKQYTDPFGATRGKNATAAASMLDRDGNGTPGDRGFLGKSNDTTGLTQIGARYHDQETGTFISPDPLLDPAKAQHLNAYAYSSQNPITFSDPSGLMQLDHLGGGGGGAAAAAAGVAFSRAATSWFGRIFRLTTKAYVPRTMLGKDAAAASRAQAAAARAQAAAQAAARAEAAESAAINEARDIAMASRSARQPWRPGPMGSGGNDQDGDRTAAVVLDTNVIIAATEYGRSQDVDAALANRRPVVTPTALKEYLSGGGSAAKLEEFLAARGGVYGPSAPEPVVQAISGRLLTYNSTAVQKRVLGDGDLHVAAEATSIGAPVLTADKKFFKTMTALGVSAERFQ
jgi:RHS repeat-associated protein